MPVEDVCAASGCAIGIAAAVPSNKSRRECFMIVAFSASIVQNALPNGLDNRKLGPPDSLNERQRLI